MQILQEDSEGEAVGTAEPSRGGDLFARAANAPLPGKQSINHMTLAASVDLLSLE